MSLEFLVTSLIVVVTPGTGVLYTLAAGLSWGARASVIAAVGCTLGIVPHMLAAITGLAALLHASALAFEVIKFLGVAYILYLAWSTLREKGALSVDTSPAARSSREIIWSGVLINLLNPKLTIFFFAFLPQFVAVDSSVSALQMIGLSAVFMVMTIVIFIGYGCFAAAVRDQVITRPSVMTWMRRMFAAAFLGLGARLAVSER